MRALISLHDVGFRLHQREILRQISLEIPPQQVLSIVGPNGAGKSTLLKLILGLLAPSSGHLVRQPNLSISYVPQKFPLPADLPMTAKRFLHGLPLAQHHAWLEQLKLEPLLNSPLQKLSGGELQRLLLLRALLRHSQLIVLDEPAAGVDIAALRDFYRLIRQFQQQQQCSVLLVSHDLDWVLQASDHIVCLRQSICCQGDPATLQHHPEFHRLLGQSA